jgi:predicted transcriptional regulator/RNA polymerase subunit RPABC4/transcription elongation factor Spt4
VSDAVGSGAVRARGRTTGPAVVGRSSPDARSAAEADAWRTHVRRRGNVEIPEVRTLATVSKITFRADEELVERLETFDASKSEVMREALRAYLDGEEASDEGETAAAAGVDSIDEAIAERVDQLVAERLGRHLGTRAPPTGSPAVGGRDINVNVTLDGATAGSSDVDVAETAESDADRDGRKTEGVHDDAPAEGRKTCGQCGENVSGDHVYCPNCGEKATHRVFCDCGDELRSDWAFCPSCGRRTPAADVLDRA